MNADEEAAARYAQCPGCNDPNVAHLVMFHGASEEYLR